MDTDGRAKGRYEGSTQKMDTAHQGLAANKLPVDRYYY